MRRLLPAGFAAVVCWGIVASGRVDGGQSGSRPIEGLDRLVPAARCGCDGHWPTARTLRVREAIATSAKRRSRAETSFAEGGRRKPVEPLDGARHASLPQTKK